MVVDAFLFSNELDLLELRCEELRGTAALHVLVEATRTFTGRPREPVFPRHRARFSRYNIVPVIVNDMPLHTTAWEREAWQRNAALRGLEGLPDDTVVLLSDADEIPAAEVVPTQLVPGDLPYFVQSFFYYSMQQRVIGRWFGTRAARLSDLQRWTPQGARARGTRALARGGWHFSYLGGVPAIQEKLRSFSHQEYNRPEIVAAEHIEHCLRYGLDLFGRAQTISYQPGLEHLPAYVRNNPDKFQQHLSPLQEHAVNAT